MIDVKMYWILLFCFLLTFVSRFIIIKHHFDQMNKFALYTTITNQCLQKIFICVCVFGKIIRFWKFFFRFNRNHNSLILIITEWWPEFSFNPFFGSRFFSQHFWFNQGCQFCFVWPIKFYIDSIIPEER